MINKTDILTAWQRIGWLETSETDYTGILDADNKTTLSTLVFDEHPMANFIGVKDTYNDKDVDATTINAFLKSWQQNSIVQVCRDVFGEGLVESGILLRDLVNLDQTIENTSKFVGWKIIVPKGFAIKLKSVGVTLDKVASFDVYIFNDSQQSSVDNSTVTAVANSEKSTALNTVLYGSSSTLKSGIYYVGYFQDDIGTAKAINRSFYPKNSPCYFNAISCTPNSADLPEDISETGNPHGLNLDYVIYRDDTQKYLESTELFDEAIRMSVWIKVLNQYLLTTRRNDTESSAKEGLNDSKIFAELNGFRTDELYDPGMKKRYLDEIKSVKKNFKNKITTATIA